MPRPRVLLRSGAGTRRRRPDRCRLAIFVEETGRDVSLWHWLVLDQRRGQHIGVASSTEWDLAPADEGELVPAWVPRQRLGTRNDLFASAPRHHRTQSDHQSDGRQSPAAGGALHGEPVRDDDEATGTFLGVGCGMRSAGTPRHASLLSAECLIEHLHRPVDTVGVVSEHPRRDSTLSSQLPSGHAQRAAGGWQDLETEPVRRGRPSHAHASTTMAMISGLRRNFLWAHLATSWVSICSSWRPSPIPSLAARTRVFSTTGTAASNAS